MANAPKVKPPTAAELIPTWLPGVTAPGGDVLGGGGGGLVVSSGGRVVGVSGDGAVVGVSDGKVGVSLGGVVGVSGCVVGVSVKGQSGACMLSNTVSQPLST